MNLNYKYFSTCISKIKKINLNQGLCRVSTANFFRHDFTIKLTVNYFIIKLINGECIDSLSRLDCNKHL